MRLLTQHLRHDPSAPLSLAASTPQINYDYCKSDIRFVARCLSGGRAWGIDETYKSLPIHTLMTVQQHMLAFDAAGQKLRGAHSAIEAAAVASAAFFESEESDSYAASLEWMNKVFVKVGVEFGVLGEVVACLRRWRRKEGIGVLHMALDFLHTPLVATQAVKCQQFVVRQGGVEVVLSILHRLQRIEVVESPQSLVAGTRVRVHSLVKKPQFNMLAGEIKEELESGRFRVVLDQGRQELSLQRINIEPLGGDVVSGWQQKCRDLIWNLTQLPPAARLDGLLPAMLTHLKCKAVDVAECEACKKIASALLAGCSPQMPQVQISASCVGAVVAALRRYSSQPDVVAAACRWMGEAAFLENLHTWSAGHYLQEMGAHAAVVAALAQHRESVAVVTDASLAIAYMCCGGRQSQDPDGRQPFVLEEGTLSCRQASLASAGAIEAVSDALARHPTVSSVQQQASFALGMLVQYTPAYRQRALEQGAVVLLIKALNSITEEAPTLRVLYALANLADSDGRHAPTEQRDSEQFRKTSQLIRDAAREAGGMEGIISSISRHQEPKSQYRLPFHALRALRYMGQDNAENQQLLLQLGAFEQIARIMRRISNNFKAPSPKTGQRRLTVAELYWRRMRADFDCRGQRLGYKPVPAQVSLAVEVEALSALLSLVKANAPARALLLDRGDLGVISEVYQEFSFTSRDDGNCDDICDYLDSEGEAIEEIFCHLIKEVGVGNEGRVFQAMAPLLVKAISNHPAYLWLHADVAEALTALISGDRLNQEIAREAGVVQALIHTLSRTLGLLTRSYEESAQDSDFEVLKVESVSLISSHQIFKALTAITNCNPANKELALNLLLQDGEGPPDFPGGPRPSYWEHAKDEFSQSVLLTIPTLPLLWAAIPCDEGGDILKVPWWDISEAASWDDVGQFLSSFCRLIVTLFEREHIHSPVASLSDSGFASDAVSERLATEFKAMLSSGLLKKCCGDPGTQLRVEASADSSHASETQLDLEQQVRKALCVLVFTSPAAPTGEDSNSEEKQQQQQTLAKIGQGSGM